MSDTDFRDPQQCSYRPGKVLVYDLCHGKPGISNIATYSGIVLDFHKSTLENENLSLRLYKYKDVWKNWMQNYKRMC